MLSRIVHDQICLTCHRIVYLVQAGGIGHCLNYGLYSLLELLVVKVHLRGRLILLARVRAQVHATKLLSCCLHIHELLLQRSLPLREISVGRDQLVIIALIDLTALAFDLNSRWCKDVLREGVHLTVTVQLCVTGKVSTSGSLRNS